MACSISFGINGCLSEDNWLENDSLFEERLDYSDSRRKTEIFGWRKTRRKYDEKTSEFIKTFS